MRAQCCICADLFESSLSVNIAASPCGHTFHEDCLMRWMESSSTCPSCRTHIKKNQIIKRLFFDISESSDGDEDVEGLLNQISNLQAQLSLKDKQKQELAESRDYIAAQHVASEAAREELRVKLNDEHNLRDIMQRDIKLLRKENAAYIEEMKEFRKTQKRLQELQNIETLLKGCESDIQDVVCQYSEASESSVKQLSSLVTVMKREYNQVLADKKVLREQVSKLKRSIGHYHSEAQKYKQEVKELRTDLEKTNESLSQVEKDNNENRRKLVHLRNALRHNKTEGSVSFHRALNEDSPNVAYTPPKFQEEDFHNLERSNENMNISPQKNLCLTPDLFDDSPVSRNNLKRKCLEELDDSPVSRNNLKRKYLEELDGPKLKFSSIPTAAERLQTSRQMKSGTVGDDVPNVPLSMLSILQKKITGQSNSRAHVPSVITRGYDGFGGSTTYVHHQNQFKASSLQLVLRKKLGQKDKNINYKLLSHQPQINKFVCAASTSSSITSTSSSSAMKEHKIDVNLKFGPQSERMKSMNKDYSTNLQNKPSSLPSSSSSRNIPKLSSDNSEFIDLI